MLELHFLNVGDGDAALIQETGTGFRLLVDAGPADADPAPWSDRQTAAEHLRSRGVDHIDVLVVTHLHKDHFGGVLPLLKEVSVGTVYSGFLPEISGERVPERPEAQKAVRGMVECLNLWAETAEALTELGCTLHPVPATLEGLSLPGGLTMDLLCPDEAVSARQRRVWQAMLDREPVEEDVAYRVSKTRNPNSLRVRLAYAGRTVEIAGDCYGQIWEGEGEPCDILKVPHHGDPRAVTPLLAERLRPRWAVISCAAEYIPRKDRPSRHTMGLLEKQGTALYFTDSFGGAPRRESVDFQIADDGTITAPAAYAAAAAGGKDMITSVLFDMGGTLEDIFVDEASEREAVAKLDEMLRSWDLDPQVSLEELKALTDDGWKRYAKYRDATDVELKPIPIWRDYVLSELNFPAEKLEPHCEEIAHMWEVTYYHRSLRPRVADMLEGLKSLGLKLGIISNTAALYQVFDILGEYGIREYFQDVTLSSVVGLRKPAGDIFEVATRQLCSAPEECVYVGDTVSRDIIGSKRAGFAKAIQIGSQLTTMKDAGIVREFEPDYLIEDIYDVYPIVKDLLGR